MDIQAKVDGHACIVRVERFTPGSELVYRILNRAGKRCRHLPRRLHQDNERAIERKIIGCLDDNG